ncbi:GNAT family N-acetyltransferase [Marivita geojedonensis]|uniref:GNAT family N-acetyltransferase n=1 Tax=Marivita geojedonensis TaxID=1123756 RepID=UPI000A1E0E51|nr:GNAT family N-acetyltransferase [Marivita geojedonensis]PRY81732.1 acetyltransferase (GNAT) family protein [Marivita geojedonensis]
MTRIVETFGPPSSQALQARAWARWQELRDDPAIVTHGRALGLASPDAAPLSRQVALAREMGAAACEHVPEAELAARFTALEAEGLKTDSFVDWGSSAETLPLARARLAARPFADDLTLGIVGPDTSAEVMAGLDAVTQMCEVLLPLGPFIRGLERPAVCAYVAEPSGRIVGASASVEMFHPDSNWPGLCWWGMLSTHPDRRGEGIASRLGAVVLDEMNRRHGTTRFFTGIRTGNTPSEALCTQLGFGPTPYHVVLAIDPELMAGGRVTK